MDKQKLHNLIIKFLMQFPQPNDERVHKLAVKAGMEPDDFEEHVYAILGSLLTGGRSKDFKGKYNPKELKMGIEIEKEHTAYPLIAEKIAKDHLAEIPDYYTRLKKMEAEGGVSEE